MIALCFISWMFVMAPPRDDSASPEEPTGSLRSIEVSIESPNGPYITKLVIRDGCAYSEVGYVRFPERSSWCGEEVQQLEKHRIDAPISKPDFHSIKCCCNEICSFIGAVDFKDTCSSTCGSFSDYIRGRRVTTAKGLVGIALEVLEAAPSHQRRKSR